MKMIRLILPLCFASALGLISSCGSENTTPKEDTLVPPTPFVSVAPDTFDVDTAYAFIEKQLAFGPRTPNSATHDKCALWLEAKFKAYKAEVTVQSAAVKSHDNRTFNIKNIVASYNPAATRRVIVSAHWDSRPFADQDKDGTKVNDPVPAANDGASGVAIILELARQFSLHPPSVGVDLILWDAEDYGAYDVDNSFCLGSQHWAKNKHKDGYTATWGINLDMVGAEAASFTMEDFTMQNAAGYAQNVWTIAGKLGYGNYFPWTRDSPIIDDHYYVMQTGIPMVEVIDRKFTPKGSGFFPWWHTTGDTIDKISKPTLMAVGQTVMEVLYRER